jgi:hypothetical protein
MDYDIVLANTAKDTKKVLTISESKDFIFIGFLHDSGNNNIDELKSICNQYNVMLDFAIDAISNNQYISINKKTRTCNINKLIL